MITETSTIQSTTSNLNNTVLEDSTKTFKPPNIKQIVINNKRTLIAVALLITITVISLPSLGFAFGLDDIRKTIDDFLASLSIGILNAAVEVGIGFLNAIGIYDIITLPFSNLFGSSVDPGSSATPIYQIMKNVWEIFVMPVAQSILSLAFLVQLIKTAQKIDSNQTMPTLKEIIFMFVFFGIWMYLIAHSWDLCESVFGTFNDMADKFTHTYAASASLPKSLQIAWPDDAVPTLATLIIVVLVGIIFLLACISAVCFAYVICWARALQIYLYAAFSPIPLSLLSMEHTRSYGIGFIKNFIAISLAGIFMCIVVYIFPFLCVAAIGTNAPAAATDVVTLMVGDGISLAAAIIPLLRVVAAAFLFIFALNQCGQWARDLLGG